MTEVGSVATTRRRSDFGHGSAQELNIDGNAQDLRRTAIDVFATRIDADLVPLIDDSVIAVHRGVSASSVRTLRFVSDHQCDVVVTRDGSGIRTVEFVPQLQSAFDVDMCDPGGVIATGRWSAGKPVIFTSPPAGLVRFVYGQFHRSRPVRRYETEWVRLS